MSVYVYTERGVELLVEDGYKSNAIDGNVAFREGESQLASAFMTMGAGSGFTIFRYDGALDGNHMSTIVFDNNADVDGELPYDPIWDEAEDYEVTDNGYHDVTLGESWTVVDDQFRHSWTITEEHIEEVTAHAWDAYDDITTTEAADTTEEE